MLRKLALLSLLPIALLCVGVIRLLAQFGVLIRFGELFSSRIGHLAGNLECYLCERDAGVQPKAFDIWVHQPCEPANKQLARMIERAVPVDKTRLVCLVSLVNVMFDGWEKHIISPTQYDRDIYNLYERFPAHLSFTAAEIQYGEAMLYKWGIEPPRKWVCLIVRDGQYLPTLSYHRYRDTDIDTYSEAALALAERGYVVFRMGAKVAKHFSVKHPRIFDYAANGMRSDFMDVYLAAHCAFCVTSGTGLDAVCASFRRPMCFVNYAPFEYLPTWFKGSVGIWKHHLKDGRRMSIPEIAASGAGHFMQAADYEAASITLEDNSPSEIREAVEQMADFVAGITPQGQDGFEAQFPRSLSKLNAMPLHGEIRMRIGSAFLRQYAAQPERIVA